MPRGKQFSAEQIIGKLREAEVELSRGNDVPPGVTPVSKLGLALATDQPCSLAEA